MYARFCRLMAGLVLLIVIASPLPAVADTGRVALVIGNGDYGAEIGKLRNPTNDAKLMARTLKQLGFKVILALNVDQKGMKRSIRDFGAALKTAGAQGVGLFYYAGHGVQVDGTNYLLPIGAQIQSEGDVELEAVSASTVLAQMQYSNVSGVNLVFLDACRNNPLTRGFRDSTRGLARLDAPRGSFIGYSTAPGEVSADGAGDNSPYSLALADELQKPGEAIETVHRNVRLRVLDATQQQQTPWDSSSLTATVTLAAGQVAAAPKPVAQPAAQPAPAGQDTMQAEQLYWESAKDSTDPKVFQFYLQRFPNGIYAPLAQDKLQQLGAGATPATQQLASVAAENEILPLRGVYVATKSANIRSAPDSKANVLGKLKANESITVTGQSADAKWLQVTSSAGTGYVSAPLLKQDAALTARAAVPEPAPAPAPAPVALEPATPANALQVSESLRPAIEKYLSNSQKQTGNFRFLALSQDGTRIGQSVSCKMKVSGYGGYGVDGCADANAAQKKALGDCGGDCRVIFDQAKKLGDFDIVWVKSDGSTETAELAASEPAPAPVPAATETASAAPIETASADSGIVRISSGLRADVEKYLANSQSQTGNFRFLAVSGDGSRIGLSTSCKMKVSGYGGFGVDGCADEEAARKKAVDACGSDCRIIFEAAKKVGEFEIEWY